jgi:enamine deaminase RidA (YjgF/YER057c/UK114 family)
MREDTTTIRHLNPPDLGPPPGYSQVVEVRASRIVFIAGQTALDSNGTLIGHGDFATQVNQVFHNLAAAAQKAVQAIFVVLEFEGTQNVAVKNEQNSPDRGRKRAEQ